MSNFVVLVNYCVMWLSRQDMRNTIHFVSHGVDKIRTLFLYTQSTHYFTQTLAVYRSLFTIYCFFHFYARIHNLYAVKTIIPVTNLRHQQMVCHELECHWLFSSLVHVIQTRSVTNINFLPHSFSTWLLCLATLNFVTPCIIFEVFSECDTN